MTELIPHAKNGKSLFSGIVFFPLKKFGILLNFLINFYIFEKDSLKKP